MGTVKKQHFIPVFILKRHTATVSVPYRSNVLWQFDKKTGEERLCNIRDVCRKKNLYEIRDSAGHIVHVNHIEKTLGRAESRFGVVLKKIDRFEQLTNDDLAFLYSLVIFQIMRTPASLTVFAELLLKSNPALTVAQTETLSRVYSFLPERNHGSNSVTRTFDSVNRLLCGYAIHAVYGDVPFILSGDKPVQFFRMNSDCNHEFDAVFFPVSQKFCLRLSHLVDQSFYLKLPNECIMWLNGMFKDSSQRFVYGCVRPSLIESIGGF